MNDGSERAKTIRDSDQPRARSRIGHIDAPHDDHVINGSKPAHPPNFELLAAPGLDQLTSFDQKSLVHTQAQPEDAHLAPGRFVDSDHPTLIAFAQTHARGESPREIAVSLYYAIRDGFRYNPWGVDLEPDSFTASNALRRGPMQGAHCIDKANILAACSRVLGIPSRLHFANVRNHIGTARLEATLGSDLLVYHGYCELWLDGRWVAATPAFNRELCERLGVAPLEFDGVEDSVFQEYDHVGGRFMEYVTDHGAHADIPFDDMVAAWRHHYPAIRESGRWPTPE